MLALMIMSRVVLEMRNFNAVRILYAYRLMTHQVHVSVGALVVLPAQKNLICALEDFVGECVLLLPTAIQDGTVIVC